MIVLYIIVVSALAASFLINAQKTKQALKVATKKFLNILPQFLLMIIFVSISLFFIPETTVAKYLSGENILYSTLIASILGSVTIMPGFVVSPLGAILISKGVSYTVIAGFTTTLMSVGVLTYPVEKKFLGTKKDDRRGRSTEMIIAKCST